jgi:ABC-type uncharacterized transport system involved in gliding motility auxiliary subunit
MKAYTTPLSLLGAALVLAGGLSYLLDPEAGYGAAAHVVSGAVIVVIAGVLNPDLFRQYGRWVNAFWGAIMVLGIVVMVNFLADRYPKRLDLTAGKLHSLSELTLQTLEGLDQEIEALAFMEGGENEALQSLLESYAVNSPRFTFELIDPDREPDRTAAAGVTQYNTLVVSSGPKQQQLTTLQEKEITDALLKVTRDRQEKVYFTVGHGEAGLKAEPRGLSALKQRLEEISYAIGDPLFLARAGRVPQDCSLLIVAGPRTQFFSNEIEAIRGYLASGGSVLVMLDPGTATGLEDLLAEFGAVVGDDFVIDTSGIGSLFGLDFTTPMAATYGEHPITRKHKGLMTFFQVARSVRLQPQGVSGRSGVELVLTSDQGWAESDLSVLEAGGQRTVKLDDGVDQPGPVPIAVAVETAVAADSTLARLVVFGDVDFATDQFFAYQGNGDLALNTVSWLAEDEALISIRPREAGHNPISLTAGQASWVFWVTVVIMPLIVALAGLYIVSSKGQWSLADLAAAGLGVVLSLGVVLLLNFMGARYHYRFDLTAEKLHTLDSQTVELLDSVQESGKLVDVKTFSNELEAMRFKELMVEYRYRASNFSYEFVDPQKNALQVKQYDIRQRGTSIVEVQADGAVRSERITEQTEEALSNAVSRALRARDLRICFTTGHGEGDLDQVDGPGYSILRGRLREMNFDVVEDFALGVDELNSETDIVAVLTPKTALGADELASLAFHLDRGGKALVWLDPGTASGLEPLLAGYGINVGDNFVVDHSGLGQMIGADVSVPVVLDYGQHPITEKLGQGVMSFFPLARSVEAGGDRSRKPTVDRIVLTHQSSWGETDLSPILGGGGGAVDFDPATDLRGPLSLAVAASVDADTSLGAAGQARLVVFGDADFMSNQYFGQQANGQLIVGSVTWLGEGDERLEIAARTPAFNPIDLIGNSGSVILWVSVFILPFAVALSGLVMVLRSGYSGYAEGALSWLLYTFTANALFLFITATVRLSEANWLAGEALLALALVGAAVAYGMHRRARWAWAPALALALLSAIAGFGFIPHDTIKLVYAAIFVVNAAILAWIRAAFDE